MFRMEFVLPMLPILPTMTSTGFPSINRGKKKFNASTTTNVSKYQTSFFVKYFWYFDKEATCFR